MTGSSHTLLLHAISNIFDAILHRCRGTTNDFLISRERAPLRANALYSRETFDILTQKQMFVEITPAVASPLKALGYSISDLKSFTIMAST